MNRLRRYFVVNGSDATTAGGQKLSARERALVLFNKIKRVTLRVVLRPPISILFLVGSAAHGAFIVDLDDTRLHFLFAIYLNSNCNLFSPTFFLNTANERPEAVA